MSKLSRFLRQRREGQRPPLEQRYREVIARYAPGISFVDIGCMWVVNGAYAFHAAEHGAASVVGFDKNAPTPEFTARNAELGNPVRFVGGDVNDSRIWEMLGCFDVVFCAGILYHMPNPILTLEQLRRICKGKLILGSATVPERGQPQSAVFLPFLDEASRQRLTYRTTHMKRGLDAEFLPERGYGNWFWLFKPSCVRAMLKTAGFDVMESYEYPRAVCMVCQCC